MKVEPIAEEKSTRGEILQQLWLSFIKDEIDVTNPIQTKAELSYATQAWRKSAAGMEEGGRIERDERREGSQMGGRLAACIWVHSKSLTGNGQRHLEIFWARERESFVEADNWDCAIVQDDNDCVSNAWDRNAW